MTFFLSFSFKAQPFIGLPGARYAALLLPQDFFDLAYLFLNFAGFLFVFAFGFQLGIQTELPGDLLELARRSVKIAFRLVFRAGFHGIPPVGISFDGWYIGLSHFGH
jgi:hypothetical protein